MTDTIENLQKQIIELKRRIASPKTELMETDNYFIVQMEAPVSKIEWCINDNQILFVTLYREKEYPIDENLIKTIYNERNYGKITRRVKLPSKTTGMLREDWENGILSIIFLKDAN